jgi:hypothetical protein
LDQDRARFIIYRPSGQERGGNRMIRRIGVAAAGVLWFASTVAAQPEPASSFEELALRTSAGETVFVVDATGEETKGRIATLSDLALAITTRETRRNFAAREVTRIERRRRDSVWNGLLIGGAAGALVGLGLGPSLDSPACPQSPIECGQGAVIGIVGGAFWGSVGGWIADALMRKRETIYVAPGAR